MKSNLKFLSLISILLSCFICACVSPQVAKNGADADTDKAAESTAKSFEPFYVYEDFMSPNNHYAPSGWMGDVANLELDQSCSQSMHEGKTCIKLRYNADGL